MRYTFLGRTGLRVSELALGAMTFGEEVGWGTPKRTAAKLLDLYAEAGGNFIDTANIYTNGTSETILGELLEGHREEFVLATKYTCATRPGDPNSAGNHRKSLVSSLENSLRRLRTDSVDILYVHVRDVFTPLDEVMRALDDQVRRGKVLYVAVSDWSAWEVSRANTLAELKGWSPFAGLQIRYNLLDRSPERELLPMARELGLGVIVWGPLAEGRLTGKYLDGGSGRLTDDWDWAHTRAGSDDIVREVVRIAKEGGWSPAQVALAWLRSRPGVVIPLLGATKEHQLRDNLSSLAVELGDEALRRLDEVSAIPKGFPGDFLADAPVAESTYGDRRHLLDDRRPIAQRSLDERLRA